MTGSTTDIEIPGLDDSDEPRPSMISRLAYSALCLIAAFAVLAFGAVDPASWVIIAVISAAVVLLWTFDALSTGRLRLNVSPMIFPILGLLLIGLIQLIPIFHSPVPDGILSTVSPVPISMDPFATRTFVTRLLVYVVFTAAAFRYVDTGSRLRLTTYLIVGFGALLAFAGILQRLASPDAIFGLRPTPQAIPFGPYVNQHHFAALMEMTGGLALAFVFRQGGRSNVRLIFIIAALLMGVATVMTSSRGGILSFVATMSFVVLASIFRGGGDQAAEATGIRSTRNLALIAGAAAMVLLIVGSVLYLGADSSLIRGIGLVGGDDISNGRAHFWPIAISIFFAHPILGAGLDAFGVAFTHYDTWAGIYRVEQAHNDYLQILADAGLAGFACAATFIYLLFSRGAAVINSSADGVRRIAAVGALAGCFGVLIHSFFDFPLRTPGNAFVFLAIVVIATANIRPQGDQ